MRLLYIATNFSSLTHTFIAREITALRRRGVRVEMLALRPAGASQAADPECDLTGCRFMFPVAPLGLVASVLRLALGRPGRWWRAVAIAAFSPGDGPAQRWKLLGQLAVATTAVRWVESVAPDLIHAHLANPPGSYALFLSLLTGIPFSFTGHAADLYRQPVGNIAKLRHARGAVAISEFNRRHYETLVPRGPRVTVVHCGVRGDEFPYRYRERVAEPLVILAVGRLVEKKGFRHLLDALARLRDEGVAWRAVLAGDGPLLPALREQRAALDLESLEIAGPLQIADVRRLLGEADAFVLPCVVAPDGDIDGIPVSLMEAMASGCPVVSTSVSGIPELLNDGAAGLIVPPADPLALAGAIRRLRDEPGLAPRLSEAGRRRIEAAFEIDGEAAKLHAFFDALLTTDGS